MAKVALYSDSPLKKNATNDGAFIPGFDWSTDWTKPEYAGAGFSISVYNMFVRAVQERLDRVGIFRMVIQGYNHRNTTPPGDMWAPNAGYWNFLSEDFAKIGDYTLRDYSTTTGGFFPVVTFNTVGWKQLQHVVTGLAQYFVKHREYNNNPVFSFDDKKSINSWAHPSDYPLNIPSIFDGTNTIFGVLPGTWPTADSSYWKNYGPNYYIPGMYNRRYPREIAGINPLGGEQEGWIARLASGIYNVVPNPAYTPSQFGTPQTLNLQVTADQIYTSGQLYRFTNGAWILNTDPTIINPDFIQAKGQIQTGDYFGPWILNDLRDAINLLVWTFGSGLVTGVTNFVNGQLYSGGILATDRTTWTQQTGNYLNAARLGAFVEVFSAYSFFSSIGDGAANTGNAFYFQQILVNDSGVGRGTGFGKAFNIGGTFGDDPVIHPPDPAGLWGYNPISTLIINEYPEGGSYLYRHVWGFNPKLDGVPRTIDYYIVNETVGGGYFPGGGGTVGPYDYPYTNGGTPLQPPQFTYKFVKSVPINGGDPVFGLPTDELPDDMGIHPTVIVKWDVYGGLKYVEGSHVQ